MKEASSAQKAPFEEAVDSKEKVQMDFVAMDGSSVRVVASVGENILNVAERNGIDMVGACESGLACSTCHCIVDDSRVFEELPAASSTELDLLESAWKVESNSRLGCQVGKSKIGLCMIEGIAHTGQCLRRVLLERLENGSV